MLDYCLPSLPTFFFAVFSLCLGNKQVRTDQLALLPEESSPCLISEFTYMLVELFFSGWEGGYM